MSKVYVAMSGGVDSSVAAALLKKRGFNLVGVFFKPWSPQGGKSQITNHKKNTQSEILNSNSNYYCQWEEDRQDAMRVCAKLGIPFKTWDFSKEYEKEVVRYMVGAYKKGITPNPDVMCNKEIKFGLFLKKALKEGADFIATGHYIRLRSKRDVNIRMHIPSPKGRNGGPKGLAIDDTNKKNRNIRMEKSQYSYRLLVAKDKDKDQSYFLWTLTQKQLGHCLFPIGEYTKPEVRKLAKNFGLPNHGKKDSQGVCFVGQLNMKEFLKNYIKPKAGDIILAGNGEIIGRHDGVFYYTIGQRHGLDIKDGHGPYFVINKDIKKNILYVSRALQVSGKKTHVNSLDRRGPVEVKNINWVDNAPNLSPEIKVRIRYRSELIPVVITAYTHAPESHGCKPVGDRNPALQGTTGVKPWGSTSSPRPGLVRRRTLGEGLVIEFKKPARAVTPGQSAVFYRGDEVLGGGIII